MAEFSARANFGLRIGNFELDFSDGELRFKASVDFEAVGLEPTVIKNALVPATGALNRYYPGLRAVEAGLLDSKRALEQVESEALKWPPNDFRERISAAMLDDVRRVDALLRVAGRKLAQQEEGLGRAALLLRWERPFLHRLTLRLDEEIIVLHATDGWGAPVRIAGLSSNGQLHGLLAQARAWSCCGRPWWRSALMPLETSTRCALRSRSPTRVSQKRFSMRWTPRRQSPTKCARQRSPSTRSVPMPVSEAHDDSSRSSSPMHPKPAKKLNLPPADPASRF